MHGSVEDKRRQEKEKQKLIFFPEKIMKQKPYGMIKPIYPVDEFAVKIRRKRNKIKKQRILTGCMLVFDGKNKI